MGGGASEAVFWFTVEMLNAAIKIVLAGLVGVSLVMIFASLIASMFGLVQTARRRKPTVHFLVAITSRNVIFRPELYDDDACRWSKLHLLGFLGVVVFLTIGGVAMLCLKGFE